MIDELPDMMTVSEVAARLRKSVSTVRRMCARGELECAHVGRTWLIPRSEVARILKPVKLAGGRELSKETLLELTRDDEDSQSRRAAARSGSGSGSGLRGDAPVQVRIIG